jgi:hypothetical protein
MLKAPWSIACCAGTSMIVCGVLSRGSVSLCNEADENCVLTTLTSGRFIDEFSFSSAKAKAGTETKMQKAVVDKCLRGRLTGLDSVRQSGARHDNPKGHFIANVQPRPNSCDSDRENCRSKPFSGRELFVIAGRGPRQTF